MKPAPKKLNKNSEYRRAILERCAVDEDFRNECWIRSSRDFVFWCDVFVYTYDPKTFPNCPHRPFVLYGYQETGALKILKAIGKHDLLIEKSRQMGVSWLLAAVFLWLWLFRPAQSFLLGSRKEDLVDKPGDPSSLFWKLDYILARLPGWMQPPVERTSRHLYNHQNDSVIDGESTNTNFGRGGTRTAIDLDEFPAVENGYEILRATRDATNCRIFIGTPAGASGAYYDTRQKLMAESPEQVLTFHWSLHPIYAAGLYSTFNHKEGGKLEVIDSSYTFAPDYKYILDGKKRSPWYDIQCRRAANQQELATEVDIDYAASGWQFFEQRDIELWKKEYACKPLHTGEILLKPDWKHPQWSENAGARVLLWFHPDSDGNVPKEWDDIACGCDVATGKGGEMSSNSVASFVRRSTGEKIAEFVTNSMFPSDFAEYVLGLCVWMNNALLNWERNGPGGQFTKKVKDEGYRNLFYSLRNEHWVSDRQKEPGWVSTKESKLLLLADYRSALKEGKFINRSEAALSECSQYVHDPNGKVEHSRAKATPDPTASGESHGDRVIADAVANRTIADLAKTDDDKEPDPPPNSFGGRRLAWERERRSQVKRWGVWNRAG